MARRIRDHDWSSTPLGPPCGWPQCLQSTVELMLTHGLPMCVIWGPERIAIYNDGYRRVWGARHPVMLGRPLYAVWPEIRIAYEPLLQRVFAGETVFAGKNVDIQIASTQDAWLDVTLNPLVDAAGRIAGALATGLEKSAHASPEQAHLRALAALRESEEKQAFLLRLSDALRPLADAVAIQETAVNMLGKALQVDRCYYVEIDRARQTALVKREYLGSACDSVIGEHPLGRFDTLLNLGAAGEPVICYDIANHAVLAPQTKAYRDRAVEAFVLAPLVKETLTAAFMCLTMQQPRSWTDAEVALLSAVAERTWAAVERARAEAALIASEQNYRTLFEAIDAGVSTIEMINDDQGRAVDFVFLEHNPVLTRMTGMTNDTIGKRASEVLPNVGPFWLEKYGDVVSSGEPARFEFCSKDLDDRWFDIFAKRIGDAASRKLVVVYSNITERKRAELALRKSEGRLQRVLETEAVAVLFFSRDGVLTDANDVFLRMTGYSREDVEAGNLTWQQMTPPEWLAVSQEQMDRFLIDGRIGPYEKEYLRKDGSRAWMLFAGRDLGDGTIVELGVDIVDRKRAEAALRESESQLRTADRQKDEFLAMLAHELRNPLAPIRMASELLARTVPDGSRESAAISILKRQTVQLGRLVDDLMDVSRITQGRIKLKREIVDLASVVAQAMEAVEPQLREKQHDLTLTADDAPISVNGDFARLVQSVSNVLANAVKYTKPGGKIDVELRAEHAHAIIRISDNGLGMSAELLPKVFDLFVQSDRTLDRAQGGLGIGLSVVKRLIEMHDGEVNASSPGPGGGSTFEFRLPQVCLAHAAPAEPPAPSGLRRRVLIVDDNQDAADSVAMVLESSSHVVQAVYSGREALKRIGMFRPDAVLLDLGLPEINGYELAAQLRAQPQWKATRLIAVTGYGQPEDRRRTKIAGFDEHLVKPVDFDLLERILSGMPAQPNASNP